VLDVRPAAEYAGGTASRRTHPARRGRAAAGGATS
jgi:hypothetical protein